MKFHENKLLTAVAAAALMLAVGACSSSSDDDEVAVDDDEVAVTAPNGGEPVACEGTAACLAEAMTNLEAAQEALVALEASDDSTLGEVAAAKVAVTGAETALTAAQTAHDEYIAMQPAPVPSVVELFGTAQDSKDAAAAAAKAAEGAVEAATEAAGKLTTLMVKGDSMTATTNAEAVLGAQITAVEAATNAETALQDAEDALEDATEHAADNASLIAALDAAIKAAETDVKTATDARDGEALKDAVAKVTGADEDEPMSAADHGQMVAMAIGGALGPRTSTDGAGERVMHDAAPTGTTDAEETAVRMDDHTGKTWEEIAGSANVKDMRIATGGEDTHPVRAASFDGMTFTSEDEGATATETDAFENNGKEIAASYMGIGGTAFCVGDDCRVDEGDEDGTIKVTGSWYFTPTPILMTTTDYYLGTTTEDGTTYAAENLYARFGHWLTVDDATGLATVNTYAMTGGNTEGLNVTTVNEAPLETTLLDKSATYEGTAAGMSLHKEVDGNGDPVPGSLESGAFTADVTLTARFHLDSPTLGGHINGFEGDAVDPDWRVTLVEGAFTDATLTGGGTTRTTGHEVDGEWSANSYGDANERTDGHLRRLQRPLQGRPCCRGVRHPEITVTETGSRTPFPRKGGHLCRPSFFGQFGGGQSYCQKLCMG